jgi:hypothetical protein
VALVAKKLNPTTPGRLWKFRYLIKFEYFFQWQSLQMLAMVNTPSSRVIVGSKDGGLQTLLPYVIMLSHKQGKDVVLYKKRSRTMHGLLTYKVLSLLELLSNLCSFGTFLMIIIYNPRWRIHTLRKLSTNGQYTAKSANDNLFMGATLFKPCDRYGRHGHHPNANFSCSGQHINAAGLQIV